MRQINEERLVLMFGNELHSLLGVSLGDRGLVRRAFDDLFVSHQRDVEVFGFGLPKCLATAGRIVDAIHVV